MRTADAGKVGSGGQNLFVVLVVILEIRFRLFKYPCVQNTEVAELLSGIKRCEVGNVGTRRRNSKSLRECSTHPVFYYHNVSVLRRYQLNPLLDITYFCLHVFTTSQKSVSISTKLHYIPTDITWDLLLAVCYIEAL